VPSRTLPYRILRIVPIWIFDTSSAPATPTTSHDFCFPFPVDETDAAPVMPRLHPRPNPPLRTQFRALPFPITARSPADFYLPRIEPGHCEMSLERQQRGEKKTERAPEKARTLSARTGGHIMSLAMRWSGFKDAYDLLMCAWTCGCSPCQPGEDELGRKASCSSWAAAEWTPRGSRGDGCYWSITAHRLC
jgi:hypothetical protein